MFLSLCILHLRCGLWQDANHATSIFALSLNRQHLGVTLGGQEKGSAVTGQPLGRGDVVWNQELRLVLPGSGRCCFATPQLNSATALTGRSCVVFILQFRSCDMRSSAVSECTRQSPRREFLRTADLEKQALWKNRLAANTSPGPVTEHGSQSRRVVSRGLAKQAHPQNPDFRSAKAWS